MVAAYSVKRSYTPVAIHEFDINCFPGAKKLLYLARRMLESVVPDSVASPQRSNA